MKVHKGKIFVGLFCFLLLACFAPKLSMEVWAAAGTPTVDGKYFFGNGTHLYIDAGTNADKTVVYYKDGDTKKYLNESGAVGDDLSESYVFGGSGAYNGDTNITMYGGNLYMIYSGCRDGAFTGNAYVKIYGGNVSGIYPTSNSEFVGNNSVVITGGTVEEVSPAALHRSCHVRGDSSLIIAGGTVLSIHSASGACRWMERFLRLSPAER